MRIAANNIGGGARKDHVLDPTDLGSGGQAGAEHRGVDAVALGGIGAHRVVGRRLDQHRIRPTREAKRQRDRIRDNLRPAHRNHVGEGHRVVAVEAIDQGRNNIVRYLGAVCRSDHDIVTPIAR